MRRFFAALLASGTAACASAPGAIPVYAPPPGVNEVMAGPIASDPGHTLILGDLNMPAGAEIPRHYHHGEEFIYVIGGSATVSRAGMPDVTLGPATRSSSRPAWSTGAGRGRRACGPSRAG